VCVLSLLLSFHAAVLDLEELQHYRSKLVTAFNFDLNWLASELYAIGMISSQNRDEITSVKSSLTTNDKADIMVSAMMNKLELDARNLRDIVEVLKKKPILYKEAIALLEGKKYNPHYYSYGIVYGVYSVIKSMIHVLRLVSFLLY